MKKGLILGFIMVISSLVIFYFYGLSMFTLESGEITSIEVAEVKSSNAEPPMGIAGGKIEAILQETETSNTNEDTITFLYSLKNQTGTVALFQFESEMMFDYKLMNENGEVIAHYSKEQSLPKQLHSVNIIQGESLSTEINFHNLEKGTYYLEAWLVGHELEYKKEHTFTIN